MVDVPDLEPVQIAGPEINVDEMDNFLEDLDSELEDKKISPEEEEIRGLEVEYLEDQLSKYERILAEGYEKDEQEQLRRKVFEKDKFEALDEVMKDIKQKLKGLSKDEQYNIIHNELLSNNVDTDRYELPFTKEMHNLIDRELYKYMINKGIVGNKKLEEEIFIQPEFPKKSSIITRGIDDTSDNPALIQNDSLVKNLKNKLILTKRLFNDNDILTKTQFINGFKNKDKSKTEEIVYNFLKNPNISGLINSTFKQLEKKYPGFKLETVDVNSRKGLTPVLDLAIEELNKLKQSSLNIISQQLNQNQPIEKQKKTSLSDIKLLKQINNLKNIKINSKSSKRIFKGGNKNDISRDFNIGKGCQIAQFKSGLIEFHILTGFFNEGDLKILSFFLSKTTGSLYNESKKKLGVMKTLESTQMLIRSNLNFNKSINIFFVVPKTNLGGKLNSFHSSISYHNVLRKIL